MSEKVLIVDDERNVLQSFRRQLHRQFDLELAQSGPLGLDACRQRGPFAVVISDMQMPGMNGVEFLAQVNQLAPETACMMLTGNADQKTAVDAINTGKILRFLNKPCPAEEVAEAIRAGIEHYRLVTVEKDMISKTLTGSVKVLTDVLALVNPTAFGSVNRVRPLVRKLVAKLHADKAWEYEIAAMLCQVGCVTIPETVMEKARNGEALSPSEQESYDTHPQVGQTLIGNIARLEGVSKIVGYQLKHFDGSGFPDDSASEEQIPLGARILKVALDYDALKAQELEDSRAIQELKSRNGWYDPTILSALEEILDIEPQPVIESVSFKDLRDGMVLVEPLACLSGVVLVSKGQTVTPSMLKRLAAHARSKGICEPIKVMICSEVSADGSASVENQDSLATSRS